MAASIKQIIDVASTVLDIADNLIDLFQDGDRLSAEIVRQLKLRRKQLDADRLAKLNAAKARKRGG